jgi:glycosyltransferase involved in cell wall biosynthesis
MAKAPDRARPRVLMVTEALARGGAERQMFALTQGLIERGFEVRIFELIGTVPGQARFADEFTDIGVRIYKAHPVGTTPADDSLVEHLAPYAAILPGHGAEVFRSLRTAIVNFAPDVVEGWSECANVMGGLAALSAGVPRIVLGQRSLPPPFWMAPVQAEACRRVYRLLNRCGGVSFVNNSAESINDYESWIPLRPGRIELVHNGFLPSITGLADGDKASCRIALGLPPQASVIGTLMRFAPEKDPELWVDTAGLIAAKRPETYFLLAGYGHGDIADRLRSRAGDLGLAGRLIMPGPITDVARIYAASDVFLLTSRLENLPNVLVEAQAAGIPVVAPAVGGVREAMRDGVTGILVSERRAHALAGAVLQALDPTWCERARTAGPEFVAGKFSNERSVEEMIAIYRGG